ncbi:MFS transporter [Pseudomonas sp. Leaf127]|uniref:MFS transporter n=1 Tax=Pseudomonas sp. Leaf127 TaxID=1736267 RepID=UPI00070347CC|nr:MFS transporter [Pseudomonas sp. Leaf127]KQQ60360.1 MFS transporter [Pseudomonas sp. Leaf127]
MNVDLKAMVDQRPMVPMQWLAIGICIVLNMIDGFDVLVMAFTAASVSAEWSLNGAQIGLLLSAGLFGMAAGSLFIAPWADRFGRRPLILFCLTLSGIGMLLSAFSQTATQLALLRAFTGLGIGGILASSNVIASEYANQRWRGLAVSLQSTGYALGATLGGLLSVWLLTRFGWRSVFLFGGAVTLAVIPLVLLWLPESLDFLIARRPVNALARVNRLASRLALPTLAQLPLVHTAPASNRDRLVQLLSPAARRTTLLIWLLFFLVMFGFYFVMSWTPKLLVAAGLSAQQGISGGVLLSVGGIFGAALIGALASRWPLTRVLSLFMLISAGLLVLFTLGASSVTIALGLGLLIGLFVNGCVAGLYALSPIVYDASVRATGVGWGIGIGRIGAIVSPTVAGLLLDGGWQPLHLYGVFAGVFVLAAAVLLLLKPGTPKGAVRTEVRVGQA